MCQPSLSLSCAFSLLVSPAVTALFDRILLPMLPSPARSIYFYFTLTFPISLFCLSLHISLTVSTSFNVFSPCFLFYFPFLLLFFTFCLLSTSFSYMAHLHAYKKTWEKSGYEGDLATRKQTKMSGIKLLDKHFMKAFQAQTLRYELNCGSRIS